MVLVLGGWNPSVGMLYGEMSQTPCHKYDIPKTAYHSYDIPRIYSPSNNNFLGTDTSDISTFHGEMSQTPGHKLGISKAAYLSYDIYHGVFPLEATST